MMGYKGWRIPEGNVVQVTDASGVVIWAVSGGKIELEVEKIIVDTYAGETTYTGEEFILLDIYPKTNGTVNVTYGGLTKTITDTSGAEEPNAQQVFFGTFNGESDNVETPTSGTLTIEGDVVGFACGAFKEKITKTYYTTYCSCITAIINWGTLEVIKDYAFYGCEKITSVTIPKSVGSIGGRAFNLCFNLTNVIINEGVTSIGDSAFWSCGYETGTTPTSKFTDVVIPSTVKYIGYTPFAGNLFDDNGAAVDKLCYLKTLTVLATTPPILSADSSGSTLGNLSYFDTIIIVPKGCSNAYKSADGWKEYADRIVEES